MRRIALLEPIVLSFILVPLASRGLLIPPVMSPSWPNQKELHVSSCRLWGTRFLSRPPEGGTVMTSKVPKDTTRDGHSGIIPRKALEASAKYLSWISGATFTSQTALRASSQTGQGPWWMGGFGGAGGNNGTDGGMPALGAMGDDYSEDGCVDTKTCDLSRDRPPLDSGVVPPKSSTFGPWMWLSTLWSLYALWLKRSPLLTKMLTGGVLALGGDIAAQCFEFQQNARTGPFLKDTRRLLAVAIDSMLITGPALHMLYGLMERLIPTTNGGFVSPVLHVLLDTFVFDPFFVVSFFCVTGVLESRSLRQDVFPALQREFWPAVRSSWVVSFFFCPLQYITFRYLPLEFRVLSVNVCDIVWTSVLSYFSHKEAAPVTEKTGGVSKAAPDVKPGGRNVLNNSINRRSSNRSGVDVTAA